MPSTGQAHRFIEAHYRGRRCAPSPRLRLRRYHEFDPFLLLDDFRNDRPDEYRAGFPWHPHRGIETIRMCWPATSSTATAWASRQSRLGRRAMDDGRPRHSPPGDAAGRHAGPHARLQLWANLPSSLKMTAPRYQDIRPARFPKSSMTTHPRPHRLRRFPGQARPGRGRRRRPALSRHFGTAGQAQDAGGRARTPRFRLCVRGSAISARHRSRSAS